MSEVNQAIVLQTCAKIASELVMNISTKPATAEEALGVWHKCFTTIYDSLKVEMGNEMSTNPKKGGRKIPIITQKEMADKLEIFKAEHPQAATAVHTTTVESQQQGAMKMQWHGGGTGTIGWNKK